MAGKSSKKKTAKRASSKLAKKKRHTLKKVSPDVGFYVCDGTMCRNLLELSEAIHKLNEDAFFHHVNDSKNDFANWVEAVLDEPGLAKKLRKLNSKDHHVVEILRFVVKDLK